MRSMNTTALPPQTDVARALRMGRARVDITKAEMAQRLSREIGRRVDPSLIGRYESGERTPKTDLMQAWADVAGVALSRMLSWGEDP